MEELWCSLDSLYDLEGWLIDAKEPVPKWLKELITKAEKELGVNDGLMDAEEELAIIGNKSRAVLVTIRVENTEKIGDLLDYLNTHEFEYEVEE